MKKSLNLVGTKEKTDFFRLRKNSKTLFDRIRKKTGRKSILDSIVDWSVAA